MILKGAGANGSGKTTLAREFMKLWEFTPFTDAKGKVLEYHAWPTSKQLLYRKFKTIVVLGDYRNVCGGMDAVSDKDRRLDLVKEYCDRKDTLVLYEGILVGVTWGAMGELSLRSKVPWVYWFMNTPYEECVRRVEARRKAKGNLTPFDGMRSLHPKIRSCESVARKAETAGHKVHWVDWKETPEYQVKHLLDVVKGMK